ncbi:MAG: VWA domain-containing protein, partial [Sphingomonadales bacterium]|nr:VWA domain-containing protein [Sphingomonadales bacterium]
MEQARNKDQKCPVVLLLDTSGSMCDEANGVKAIDELNKAIQSLKDEIICDPILSQRLELGIVCFDDDARVEKSIDLVSPESSLPVLQAGGTTNVVAGMNKAMEIIEERKAF